MNILNKDIEAWIRNEASVTEYREGAYRLKSSGLLEILRRIGTPTVIDYGANESVMAGQAHWANGYQTCLEHVLHFEELFSARQSIQSLGAPDFGGIEEALRTGTLRKEDI